MKKVSFAEMHCSLARSLDVMGDWWTPLILRDVFLGVDRFDDLAADLGISRNLLTRRLKHLLAGGLLEKQPYRTRPPRYAYRLTEAGTELIPVLLALMAWGDRWARPPQGVPIRIVHEKCGHGCEAVICCDACGRGLNAEDIRAVAGPGGARKPGTMVLADRLTR